MKTILSSMLISLVLFNAYGQLPTTVCQGETIYLCNVSPPGASVQWQQSPTGTVYTNIPNAVSDTFVISSIQTSAYYRARITGQNCDPYFTNVQQVVVNPAPNVSITGTSPICAGSSSTLTATGGIAYLWSNGASVNAITVSPSSSTTYAYS